MTIITMRSDNKSKWESSSSITPALGEICYEEDTNTLKIGDGEHKFKDIPTHFATSKELDELIDNNEGKIRSVVNVNRGYDIVSDKEYYNILEAQKRSTFDRSKFTVVGSPTITADGIASGFSSSNYLGINNINFSTVNSWEIKFKYTSNEGSTPDWSSLFGSINNDGSHNHSIVLFNTGSGTYLYWKLSSDGTDGSLCAKLSPALIKNKSYYITTKFTGIKYIFNIIDENSTSIYNEEIISSTKVCPFASLRIGYNATNKSIDLKQLFIKINGVEVFNGNKTGIDQIKKDDYTIVGNPTITNEGIASGFGSNSYLKTSSLNISNATDFELYTPIFTLSPKDANINQVLNWSQFVGTKFNVFNRANTEYIECYVVHKDDGTYGTAILFRTFPVLYGVPLQVKFTYKNSIYSIFWRKAATAEEDAWILLGSVTSAQGVVVSGERPICWENTECYLVGSIDLNAFKIYVDGQLVYQPTLRIPYTQSKTGNKIVDSVYRDRVQDMYEQFGYTHYYTLGDEPEKYNVEVVGSPTLVGGVASGFSNSNYLTAEINLSIANSWEIYFTRNSVEDKEYIIGSLNQYGFTINVRTGDIYVSSNGSSWDIRGIRSIEVPTSDNVKYRLCFTGSTYKYEYWDNRWITITSIASTSKVSTVNSLKIGGWFNQYYNGTIDLKQFSITVDGKEIFRGYEPAIPNAYTLQTHKNTDIIDFGTTNGITYEQTADLTLTQYGSCENGVVTNILPYKDNNYTVTTPCSSKDKDKFTPSRTGDFIAVGKTVLE